MGANSLVSVDTAAKTFKYNYEYYLMKHLSHRTPIFPQKELMESQFATLEKPKDAT